MKVQDMKDKKKIFKMIYTIMIAISMYFCFQIMISKFFAEFPKCKILSKLTYYKPLKLKNVELPLLNIKINFIKVIYTIVGLIFFVIGTIHISISCKENYRARDKKTYSPNYLIQDGIYSRIRHPMYRGFLLLNLGMWIGSCNLYGIVLGILFCAIFIFNTYFEEKYDLVPRFGEVYINYKKNTNRLFPKNQLVLVCLVTILCLLGVLI